MTKKPFPPSICSCIARELLSSSTRKARRVALQNKNRQYLTFHFSIYYSSMSRQCGGRNQRPPPPPKRKQGRFERSAISWGLQLPTFISLQLRRKPRLAGLPRYRVVGGGGCSRVCTYAFGCGGGGGSIGEKHRTEDFFFSLLESFKAFG